MFLHATAPGYSFGQVVRLEPSPSTPFPDVVLEVGISGAVEGRVIASAGQDLRGLAIAISQGDRHIYRQALDATGAFRFDQLAAGDWQAVTGKQTEIDQRYNRTAGYTSAARIEWSFQVRAGETTHFDALLEREPEEAVAFDGRLLVNGAAPIGWSWSFPADKQRTSGRFDSEGRFQAKFKTAGKQRLDLYSPRAGICGYAALQVQLELIEGMNSWSLDLTTAALRVIGPPAALADAKRP